jgi:hypothetical protein
MAPTQQEPIDLANIKKVYFDTSAWNYVSKHVQREELVRRIKQSGATILAGVISVGEVLRTTRRACFPGPHAQSGPRARASTSCSLGDEGETPREVASI